MLVLDSKKIQMTNYWTSQTVTADLIIVFIVKSYHDFNVPGHLAPNCRVSASSSKKHVLLILHPQDFYQLRMTS